MDGLQWKNLLKWMIWGYHYFRKHRYIYIYLKSLQRDEELIRRFPENTHLEKDVDRFVSPFRCVDILKQKTPLTSRNLESRIALHDVHAAWFKIELIMYKAWMNMVCKTCEAPSAVLRFEGSDWKRLTPTFMGAMQFVKPVLPRPGVPNNDKPCFLDCVWRCQRCS